MPEVAVGYPLSAASVDVLEPPKLITNVMLEAARNGNFTIEKLQETISKYVIEAKTKFPEDTSEVELIADLIGGGARLSREALRTKTHEEWEKVLSAEIQHKQVEAILYASSSESSDVYTDTVFDVVRLFEHMSRYDNGISIFWNGVKSELAVVKALRQNGYRVFLPDYLQDYEETPEDKNEVLQWDVRNGVDMVAVRRDSFGPVALLVDAKGRAFANDGNKLESVMISREPRGELPPILSNFLRSMRADSVRTKIIVPTSERHLQPMPSLEELERRYEYETSTDYQKLALSHFASLRSMDEQFMISELSRMS